MMKIPFSGGCACGAVRYECSAEPAYQLQCHCRDCQRFTGGPSGSVVVVPAEAFKVTRGERSYYFTESEGMGSHRRGFCGKCGSPLTGGENREGSTGNVGVTVGSLDEPGEFCLQMHVWTSDALPWDVMDPAVPKFEKYPTA